MRNWEAFGHVHPERREPDGSPLITSVYEHEQAMRMCGYKPGEYNKLNIVEDPEGIHFGWVSNDEPDRIRMIQHKQIFGIQFPYGVKAEESKGEGKAVSVRLDVVDNS